MSARRLAWRGMWLALLAAEISFAVAVSRWSDEFRSGIDAYNAGQATDAALRFEDLRKRRPGQPDLAAWQGDAAQAASDRWGDAPTAPERTRWLDSAWQGYAAAVLRSPADSWSWGGLAEVALRRAQDEDRLRGVDLATIDEWAHGVVDPWRAIAFGAAFRATALKPSGYQAIDVLASVYESVGDAGKAMDCYRRSARMMPAPSFHVWGTSAVTAPGMYEVLRRGVDEGIAAAPDYERSLLNLEAGRFAEKNGDRAAALAYFGEAQRRARNDYETFYGAYESARVLAAGGQYDDALRTIEVAQRTGFGAEALRRLKAQALVDSGSPAIACPEYIGALRDSPRETGLRLDAAGACERGGQLDLAERILREGFVAPEDNLVVAKALIDFERRNGRRGTATDLVRRWVRDYPDLKELRSWADETPVNPH